jgi:hypothetical protein
VWHDLDQGRAYINILHILRSPAHLPYAVCMYHVKLSSTNILHIRGRDRDRERECERRSCFYVLVSGTLLLSQGLLIGRTPKCVQMLSLRKRKHVQPSPHVCFHCRARCFHFASFFLILQSHGRPFAKSRTSQIWEVAGANTSNFCE